MLGYWLWHEDAHNTTKPDINQPDFPTVETNLSSELMTTINPPHNMVSNNGYIPLAFPLESYRFQTGSRWVYLFLYVSSCFGDI